jgi:hypothetical protein
MSNQTLDTEVSYSQWLSEKYEMEKKYSKHMESSSLLAHNHIGRLQAMLSKASYYLSDVEKEEMKKDLAEMHEEREEFYKKSETNIK